MPEDLSSYIVLDLETTGLDPQTGAEIMEFGAVRIKNRQIEAEYSTLLQTQNPIPLEIQYLTGIQDSDLASAPSLESKRQEIQDFIGDLPILGHNISFDLNFLSYYKFSLPNPSLDTCRLAETLVPSAKSFSLETLSQYFSLPKEDSHRALGDVRNTHRLFEILRTLASNLNPTLRTEIQKISQKHSWLVGKVFSSEPSSSQKTPPPQPTPPPPSSNLPLPPDLPPKFLFTLPSPSDEAPLIKSLQKNWNSPTLVLCRNEKEALTYSQNLPSSTSLFSPDRYFHPTLFQKFEKNLTPEEDLLFFWLKLKIWQNQTTKGLAAELPFRGPDYEFWSFVSTSEPSNPSPFFTQAQKTSQKSSLIFTNLASLHHSPQLFQAFPNLIVLGTETLDFRFSQTTEQKLFSNRLLSYLDHTPNTEELTNTTTILTGLLGNLIQNRDPLGKYPSQQILTAPLENNTSYHQAKDSATRLAQSLTNSSSPYLRTASKFLTSFFNPPPETLRWITLFPSSDLALYQNPTNLSENLHTLLSPSSRQNLVFTSNHFFSGIMPFIRTELDLPLNDYPSIQSDSPNNPSPLHIEVPSSLPTSQSWGSEKELKTYTQDLLLEKKLPTLFIFNSRKALIDYFEFLFAPLHEKSYTVLAEGRTGGIGKNLSAFEHSSQPIFFLTERSFRRLDLPKKPKLRILLQRLPFQWSSPFQQSRSSKYTNDFQEFSLPQALLKFDQIILSATSLCQDNGQFICLDRRILDKSYGSEFQKIIDYRNQ